MEGGVQCREARKQGMRRFIAGAVCPQCRSVDRIVVEVLESDRCRRCVACGHTEALSEAVAPEPATRFTTRASDPTPVQTVRLLGAEAARDERSEGSSD